jgi:hypothetical protein
MADARLTLVASSDDYLLELERHDAVAAWEAAHPDGESVTLDPAPGPAHLVQELVNRSLFSPARLVVVPNGAPYFSTRGEERGWAEVLANALGPLPLGDATLLVTAAVAQEPKGPLAEVFRSRGELRYLALPPPPKPWEERIVVSEAQRALLGRIVQRVAPEVARHPEAVKELCEAYGFKVRELALAAERLAVAGEFTPEAVRAQAGVGDCSVQRLESAIIERDRGAVTALLGRLSAGGSLVDWRGEAVDAGGVGPVLTGMLGRLARLGLAMRCHAQRCGLGKELDADRCRAQFWYGSTYKKRLHDQLMADAESAGSSPVAGMSPWPAHRSFRVAAAYDDAELVELLDGLARAGVERSPAREAVPALTPLLLALTAPRATAAGGRAPARVTAR